MANLMRSTGVLCLVVALMATVAVLPSRGDEFCLPPTHAFCDMELCRERCGDREGPTCKVVNLNQYACCCTGLRHCYPGGNLPGCTTDTCMQRYCPGNINAHCTAKDYCCCPFP